MFAAGDVILTALIAGALAAGALAAWPWARRRGRFALAGLATAAGWCIWNFALDAAGADGFNVDAPVVAVSGQDAGSGVLAFAMTALLLAIREPRQPSGRVVLAAVVTGMVALIFDIFVL